MKFGDIDICVLSDGTFKLDGGAMFGIVPKPLWQRHKEPDEANRILLPDLSTETIPGSMRWRTYWYEHERPDF